MPTSSPTVSRAKRVKRAPKVDARPSRRRRRLTEDEADYLVCKMRESEPETPLREFLKELGYVHLLERRP